MVNTTAFPTRSPANPGFVHLNMVLGLSTDPVLVGPYHARAELVENLKGRLVARKTKLPLKLHGGHAGRLTGDQISGPEPDVQRSVATLHHCSHRQPGVLAALAAAQDARAVFKVERLSRRAAVRAGKAVSPAGLLLAGVEALAEMMEEDATTVCGARHRRHGDRRGYRWGRTHSEIGYHGGKVKVARPRVRDRAGKEVSLESWQALRDGNLLLEWALNLMVLNVSTRKYHRAVRLPEGDLAKARGDGTSKSAVSRRFVALSRKKMKAWLASDLSELDLLVIQIDGLHVGDHVLMAAIGVDGNGDKHVLAVVEGATENTVVVQALIDNLLARGLDPTLPRLFIVDGAKALSKAIRNTFGVAAAIQRCQVHKGRNIIDLYELRTARREIRHRG